MEIKIIGEGFTVADEIQSYILKKFSHIPKLEKINCVEFRLGKNGNLNQHVKFSTNCKQKNITLDVSADNSYHAIDQLMKKIHINFVKLKETTKLHCI